MYLFIFFPPKLPPLLLWSQSEAPSFSSANSAEPVGRGASEKPREKVGGKKKKKKTLDAGGS